VNAGTEDGRFREAAAEARRYENSHFNPQSANGPTSVIFRIPILRTKTVRAIPFPGATARPEIGLDRLRAYEIFGDPALKEEAEIAMRLHSPLVNPFP
jgi:hypothetical protein